MNRLFKIVLLIVTFLCGLYWLWFYVSPAITIVNNSGGDITHANIELPSSRLDFGEIKSGASNTLYYSLSQPRDGSYLYKIMTAHAITHQGSCGYVTNNELNKRLKIVITQDNRVLCEID
ncbi:hypothetical protein [Pseudoalteromonas sp. G4]|uniref:hypothetical protein n=1 Tax=Pseudoalteromonas sp. G4 TaxID=2992761 RepID=UPI00237DCE09|nr:hypothetical protein [Pseudoalteromonas sp. G4]MDE3272847.1 hypothetical protein [Pseudoalteromonas sp. G4]